MHETSTQNSNLAFRDYLDHLKGYVARLWDRKCIVVDPTDTSYEHESIESNVTNKLTYSTKTVDFGNSAVFIHKMFMEFPCLRIAHLTRITYP